MTINVSPTISDPTHHISLQDKNGKKIGLILCDSQGNIAPRFAVNPVDRTALKTTSGASSYSDYQYPYSPITQDDWSGGRAALDFERDSTRYYDSFRMRTGRSNKAYHGPQEQWCTGYRSINQAVPGNVIFHTLTATKRITALRFQASATFTAAIAWIIAKRKGEPSALTISIHSDSSGVISTQLSSVTVASTRLPDVLSEWLSETVSASLTSGTYYWLKITASADDDSDNYWAIAVKNSVGNTYTSEDGVTYDTASFDLYYRLTPSDSNKRAIFFEYKDAQYVVISGESGAPSLYINGDRGAADSNSGQLTKLIDATKSWTTNQWAGAVVLITDGTGRLEPTPYRTVVSNTTGELVLDSAWTITHDTTTEYVIIGSDVWRVITGHGMTAPVTDVLVSTQGVVYFAQGDSVNIRRHREYNNAGTWTESDWADDGTNKAVYLTYKPQAQKIVKANNSDASTNVSIDTASVATWGTNLSFTGTPTQIGSKYRRITGGMRVYPDSSGNEAVWIMKVDYPWIAPSSGNPYPYNLPEMDTMRSTKNGAASLVHNVYLYFTLGNGLERYYSGNLDDIGPNREEGLPADRQGPIIAMLGYPGKYFTVVDGGASGYSSILVREGSGWHEHYRAPKGQRLGAFGFQPTPGAALDRMWVYQGNDIVWLPFPSDNTNELQDENYKYTHEASLTLARMHAGMFDVQKVARFIKVQSENLTQDEQWIELDYRLNEDEDWTPIDRQFTESPTYRIDLIDQFGITAKRMQFRIRSYTTDASTSPILLAFIVEAVIRTTVKNQYPLVFRLMDEAKTLNGLRQPEEEADPISILSQLQDWADDSGEGMLKMESVSRLYHDKMVFLNPITVEQANIKTDPNKDGTVEVFICSATLQDA